MRSTGYGRDRGELRPRLSGLLLAAALALSSLCAAGGQFSLSQPLTLRWQYLSERTLNLTPAIDGEQVYLPLAAGALVSLHTGDGQLLWKAETGGELSAAPVADEHNVYVASQILETPRGTPPHASGTLRALGRASGVALWEQVFASPLRGSLAESSTTLFAGDADGHVYAVSKETGEIRWTSRFPTPFSSAPVLKEGRLYIGGEDGTLWALDEMTGRTLWYYRTHGALRGPVALAPPLVCVGSADGFVYALDERDGHLRWRARTGAGVEAVLSTEKGLIAVSLDNFVYFLSLRHGERVWKHLLAGRVVAQPLAVSGGVLFAPLSGDACVVLDLRDGKQINTLPVGEDNNTAAAPVRAGNLLLVTTRRGLLAFAPPVSPARATPAS